MRPAAIERAPRSQRDWQPRLSAIEIVDHAGAWAFRLNDRATVLEVALLRLAYGGELDTDERGDVLLLLPRPRDIPRPTREDLAERLRIARGPRGN